MADMMKAGQQWFAGKMKANLGRTVTYRGLRNGVVVSVPLTVGLGMSQLTSINLLGTQPGIGDATLADPSEVDRDYIVVAADMQAAGLWPPTGGDFIDDVNDEDGVTKRYTVKSIPGSASWRWLRGSYNIMARVHTKFFQEIAVFWADTFTGVNGASLANHAPDEPAGGVYSGGSGTVQILANRIVAATKPAFKYFAPNELDTLSIVEFRFNVLAADLNGKFAELGLGVRCAPSGSGQRDGVYCTVRVGYTNVTQDVRQLRIVRRRNDANVTAGLLNLPAMLSLTSTYRLAVKNSDKKVLLTLTDESGEVAIASVDVDSTLLNDYTGQCVWFDHTLTDPTGPWIDDLTVEAN